MQLRSNFYLSAFNLTINFDCWFSHHHHKRWLLIYIVLLPIADTYFGGWYQLLMWLLCATLVSGYVGGRYGAASTPEENFLKEMSEECKHDTLFLVGGEPEQRQVIDFTNPNTGMHFTPFNKISTKALMWRNVDPNVLTWTVALLVCAPTGWCSPGGLVRPRPLTGDQTYSEMQPATHITHMLKSPRFWESYVKCCNTSTRQLHTRTTSVHPHQHINHNHLKTLSMYITCSPPWYWRSGAGQKPRGAWTFYNIYSWIIKETGLV